MVAGSPAEHQNDASAAWAGDMKCVLMPQPIAHGAGAFVMAPISVMIASPEHSPGNLELPS